MKINMEITESIDGWDEMVEEQSNTYIPNLLSVKHVEASFRELDFTIFYKECYPWAIKHEHIVDEYTKRAVVQWIDTNNRDARIPCWYSNDKVLVSLDEEKLNIWFKNINNFGLDDFAYEFVLFYMEVAGIHE